MLEPIFSVPGSVSRIKFEINIIPISVASYVATHAVALVISYTNVSSTVICTMVSSACIFPCHVRST